MCLKHEKCGTVLIGALVILIMGLVLSCSEATTMTSTDNVLETNQFTEDGHHMIDELWIINSQSETRGDITLEDIKKIIEENKEILSINGEINADLLREFILSKFPNVEILTDPKEIEVRTQGIRICCTFDIETCTITITIVVY